MDKMIQTIYHLFIQHRFSFDLPQFVFSTMENRLSCSSVESDQPQYITPSERAPLIMSLSNVGLIISGCSLLFATDDNGDEFWYLPPDCLLWVSGSA